MKMNKESLWNCTVRFETYAIKSLGLNKYGFLRGPILRITGTWSSFKVKRARSNLGPKTRLRKYEVKIEVKKPQTMISMSAKTYKIDKSKNCIELHWIAQLTYKWHSVFGMCLAVCPSNFQTKPYQSHKIDYKFKGMRDEVCNSYVGMLDAFSSSYCTSWRLPHSPGNNCWWLSPTHAETICTSHFIWPHSIWQGGKMGWNKPTKHYKISPLLSRPAMEQQLNLHPQCIINHLNGLWVAEWIEWVLYSVSKCIYSVFVG